MSVKLTVPRHGGFVPVGVRRRAANIEPVGRQVIDQMRRGSQGVREQFERQQMMHARLGTRPWVPSQRVRKFGGLTMVKSGRYRAAWMGSAGAVETVRRDSVEISVDGSRFPQREPNQRNARNYRTRNATIPTRGLGVSDGMVQAFRRIVRRHVLDGAR